MDKKKSIIIQIIFWFLLFITTTKIVGIDRDNDVQTFVASVIIILAFISISYLNVYVLVPNLLTKKKYITYTFVILLISVLIPILFVELDLIQFRCKERGIVAVLQKPLCPKILLVFFISSMFLFVSATIRLALDFSKKEKQRI